MYFTSAGYFIRGGTGRPVDGWLGGGRIRSRGALRIRRCVGSSTACSQADTETGPCVGTYARESFTSGGLGPGH